MISDINDYYESLSEQFTIEGLLNSTEHSAQVDRLSALCGAHEVESMMEIGFNAGHSADLFLSSNPTATLLSFDLGVHQYVSYGKKFIDQRYPNRHNLIIGDSKKSIPTFLENNPLVKFDFIFIDGDHEEDGVILDVVNCKYLSHEKTIVVLDDTRVSPPLRSWNLGPNNVWWKCITKNYIKEIGREDYGLNRGQSWGLYSHD